MDRGTYDLSISFFGGDGRMARTTSLFFRFLSQQRSGADLVVGYRHIIRQSVSGGVKPGYRSNLRPPRPSRHRPTHHTQRICVMNKRKKFALEKTVKNKVRKRRSIERTYHCSAEMDLLL